MAGVTIKELLVKVSTDMAGLKSGMSEMQKQVDRGKTAHDGLGTSVSGVTKKLGALAATIGVGAMFKGLISSASEFETSIANMSTLITDNNVDLGEMEQGFLDLAGPLGSAKELADAAYGAISAGVPAGEAVEFIGDMAMFAKANLIDLGSATDVVTTLLNTYGAEAGTAAEITDKLTTTIRLGKTNGEELSASLGQIAGTAKEVGISFDDLLSATVVLTSGGIKTNQAMTSLKAVISNIATPSAQAKAAAEGMAGGFNLASLKAQGFSGFLQSMVEHVKGNTQKQKDLFGSIEAFNAIAVLASEEGGQKLTDTNVELGKSVDATKTAFEKQQVTFSATMDAIKNGTEAALIQSLLPALKDTAAIMKDEGFVTGIRELGTALGSTVGFLAKFIGNIVKVPGLIRDLADVANPSFERLQANTRAAGDQIFDFAQSVIDATKDVGGFSKGELTDLSTGLKTLTEDLGGDFVSTLEDYKEIQDAIKRGDYGAYLQASWSSYFETLRKGKVGQDAANKGLKDGKKPAGELEEKAKGLKKEFNALAGELPQARLSLDDFSVSETEAGINAEFAKKELEKYNDELEKKKAEAAAAALEKLNKQLEAFALAQGIANAALEGFGSILGLTSEAADILGTSVNGMFDIITGGLTGNVFQQLGGVASILGMVGEMITGTDWAGYARAEAKALGISVEMTDRLADLAEEMGTVNGALYTLMDEIVADENVQDLESFNFWLSEIARMVGAVGNGAVPISELGEAFGALLENADGIGYLGKQFQYTVSQLEEMGISLTEIDDFMRNQMIEGAEGYAAYLAAGFSDTVMPVMQDFLDYQALLSDNSELVAGVEGFGQAIIALGNTGAEILKTDFDGYTKTAVDGFNSLIAAGFDEKEALEIMQPQLAALIGLSNDYGYAIDGNTQALIDKGEQFGIEFEKEKSANDIIAEQITRLADIFSVLLPDALDDFASAGETTFGKYTAFTNLATTEIEGVGTSIRGVIGDIEDTGDAITALDEEWTNAVSGNTMIKENEKLGDSIVGIYGLLNDGKGPIEDFGDIWDTSIDDLIENTENIGYHTEQLGQTWGHVIDGIIYKSDQELSHSIAGIGVGIDETGNLIIDLGQTWGDTIDDLIRGTDNLSATIDGSKISLGQLLAELGRATTSSVGQKYGVYDQAEKEAMTLEFRQLGSLFESDRATILSDPAYIKRFLSDLEALKGGILDENKDQYERFVASIRSWEKRVARGDVWNEGSQTWTPQFEEGTHGNFIQTPDRYVTHATELVEHRGGKMRVTPLSAGADAGAGGGGIQPIYNFELNLSSINSAGMRELMRDEMIPMLRDFTRTGNAQIYARGVIN